MSQKAWLVQVPSDSPMPFVQLMDWFDQCAKAGWLCGVNYTFYSNTPPPQFQINKGFTIAFTTEGVTCLDTFPIDLMFSLNRLDYLTNPFWHDQSVFEKWTKENAKFFQDPNEIMAFIKTLEKARLNGKSN
jgi:hypothetical protein